MTKYYLQGALETLLLSLPVPLLLLILGSFLPLGVAFVGAGLLAVALIWKFALPEFCGE